MDFNSLDDLFMYIEKQSKSTLVDEVATATKKRMSKVIEDVTYEEYTPTMYVRTHQLSDIKSMEVSIIDDDTIQIVNTRRDGKRDVATIVAEGVGYTWVNSAIFKAQPYKRDYYEDTYRFLEQYGDHIEAYKKGMLKRGITLQEE